MKTEKGSTIKDIRQHNRFLVLKHIAIRPMISRMDLSEITGLSKMAVGNMVTDLMEMGLVEEIKGAQESSVYGRPPGVLRISSSSPLICGMLITRGSFRVVLADLSGSIVDQEKILYEKIQQKSDISKLLLNAYHLLLERQRRHVIAVGISSIGPVDTNCGIILNPPFFYGISNVPIVEEIQVATGLPTFLINDANSGALAEKLYGLGQTEHNFSYLHIMNGIGIGCVLDGKMYGGDSGQSGELGHTTINCMGPKCECGNIGCLELYANVENMRARIAVMQKALRIDFPLQPGQKVDWITILNQANLGNQLAVLALEEFCTYVSYAMTNVIRLLDLSLVIVGYDSDVPGSIIEQLLQSKLQQRVPSSDYRQISVKRSTFDGDTPLIGAIACCAEKIFDLSLQIFPEECQNVKFRVQAVCKQP